MNLKLDARGKRVLIIPDTHHPYHHPDSKKFLAEIKRHFKPQIVIHLGDEVDYHALSFHDSDHDLFSVGQELTAAIDYLQDDLHSLFPNLYLLESNHGSMLYRKFKHHGIPIRALKPLAELYQTPKWTWHREINLQTKLCPVTMAHGMSSVPLKMALARGTSSIQGHFHGEFRLIWKRFDDKRLVYDLISGCLIDPTHDAFAYGRNTLPKPILGASIIHANGMPELVPMI